MARWWPIVHTWRWWSLSNVSWRKLTTKKVGSKWASRRWQRSKIDLLATSFCQFWSKLQSHLHLECDSKNLNLNGFTVGLFLGLFILTPLFATPISFFNQIPLISFTPFSCWESSFSFVTCCGGTRPSCLRPGKQMSHPRYPNQNTYSGKN